MWGGFLECGDKFSGLGLNLETSGGGQLLGVIVDLVGEKSKKKLVLGHLQDLQMILQERILVLLDHTRNFVGHVSGIVLNKESLSSHMCEQSKKIEDE